MSSMIPRVLVIGGGMIVHDQILPSLYQLQRLGRVGEIAVCASQYQTVKRLAEAETIRRAFPGQTFRMLPHSDGEPRPGVVSRGDCRFAAAADGLRGDA